MKALYELAKLSKQAHWKWVKRQEFMMDKYLLLDVVLTDWRSRHPAMSLKKLHHKIQPDFIGVNAFTTYGMTHGFEPVSYKKSPKISVLGESPDYPNLLIDLKISDINQVWVSDTTYFKINGVWFYITFVMDLYSRRIIGYHADKTLLAAAHLKALEMAILTRAVTAYDHRLIHHSDRGVQYKSNLYADALKAAQINISMGRIVYDNIHIERVHQTIKGEYLIHRNIQSEKNLKYHLQKDVRLYNEERPHLSLKKMTPGEFESYLSNVPLCQRNLMSVFALRKNKRSRGRKSQQVDENQLVLEF